MSPGPPIPELRVVAANLHWGYGYRRVKTRDRRIDLRPVIEGFDADVLMLPESFEPDDRVGLNEILRGLGYETASVPLMRFSGSPGRSHRPDDPGWWHLTLATRRPLLQWRAVPMGRVTRDPAGERFAIHAEVDVGGTRLHAIAVHTSSKLWYLGPEHHLLALRRNLGRIDGPAVIGGDCNFWGPGVERLLPGWKRAVIGRSWPADRPHSQIDHILVNGKVGVRDGGVLEPYGSDHRPVWAQLEV